MSGKRTGLLAGLRRRAIQRHQNKLSDAELDRQALVAHHDATFRDALPKLRAAHKYAKSRGYEIPGGWASSGNTLSVPESEARAQKSGNGLLARLGQKVREGLGKRQQPSKPTNQHQLHVEPISNKTLALPKTKLDTDPARPSSLSVPTVSRATQVYASPEDTDETKPLTHKDFDNDPEVEPYHLAVLNRYRASHAKGAGPFRPLSREEFHKANPGQAPKVAVAKPLGGGTRPEPGRMVRNPEAIPVRKYPKPVKVQPGKPRKNRKSSKKQQPVIPTEEVP